MVRSGSFLGVRFGKKGLLVLSSKSVVVGLAGEAPMMWPEGPPTRVGRYGAWEGSEPS